MTDVKRRQGHHKTRRKGRRSYFDRRKNDEHKNQALSQLQKRQPLVSLNCQFDSSKSEFESMKEDMANFSLPDQWLMFSDRNTIEFCQLTKCTDETRQVTRSLSIFSDFTWLVKVNGQVVPAKSKVLANYSPILASSRIAEDMIRQIDKSILCPGNPEPEFVSLCKKRGGGDKGGMEMWWHSLMNILLLTPVEWSICLLLEEWTVTYSVYYPVATQSVVSHVSHFAPHFAPRFPGFARRKT